MVFFIVKQELCDSRKGILLKYIGTKMRSIVLVSAVVMFASAAHAQPVSCNDDAQCYDDYFCETAVHFCQKCLHCEDLKREAPLVATTCIKSVVKCGSCLQGLMVDHRGDVNGECVPPEPSADESSPPVYIWSIIGFLVLGFFIAIIIIIIYVLRRKDLFRISTATWLRSSCTSTNINASAPDPPPPYNPYTPVRADSPFTMPDVAYSPHSEEPSHPFIKRAPGDGSGPGSAREAAGSQNARVFDPPAYVRINSQTPISPLSESEDSNHWPSIHNEDTTPHDWTPNTSTNDNNGNVTISEVTETESAASAAMSSDLPALLAAARDTTLVAPPAKKLKTQDNNNNGRGGAASGEDGVGPSTTHASEAPSIYFNIVQINNTKL